MRRIDVFSVVALWTRFLLSLSRCPPSTNRALSTSLSAPPVCRARTNLTGRTFRLFCSDCSTSFQVPLMIRPRIYSRFASSNWRARGSWLDRTFVKYILYSSTSCKIKETPSMIGDAGAGFTALELNDGEPSRPPMCTRTSFPSVEATS
jgi:hypothetical protein